ncbi:MAG: VWA domain-containing protein [Terracidiphilus sp.]
MVLLLASLATAATIRAQALVQDENAAQKTPQFKVNVRLVVLDVVVTDASGKSVDGLTANDFEVFEDGKLQQIRSLEGPSFHKLPASSDAAGASQVFNPAQPANFGQSPVTILLLDQLNTHFADSSFARRELHDYLIRQPAVLAQPAALLMLYDDHLKQLQSFTRDREILLRALAAAPTEYAWKLELQGSADLGPLERLDQSLHAIEQIAQSDARIPGRKNLLWVGGGFPSIDPQAFASDDIDKVKEALRQITNAMLDARITLYAVDPSSLAPGMTEITDISQADFTQAAGDSMLQNSATFNADEDFDGLGVATGGRVVRGMNDVAQQIQSAVNLGADFYTLSYSPNTPSEMAAQYRKIKVVCLRPGLKVNTRTGYFSGRSEEMKSDTARNYDLTTAVESSIPLNGLVVKVVPNTSPGVPPNTYLVRVGAADLTWNPKPSGAFSASVSVMSASLNAAHRLIGHTLRGMIATAKPGTDVHDPARMASFVFTAQPAPKASILRFIVRDNESGRMGSVDLALKARRAQK